MPTRDHATLATQGLQAYDAIMRIAKLQPEDPLRTAFKKLTDTGQLEAAKRGLEAIKDMEADNPFIMGAFNEAARADSDSESFQDADR